MKVLFLDFDGVLNIATDFSPDPEKRTSPKFADRWSHDLSLIRSELVALIDEVCLRTGAKIVFSTSWRYSDSADYLHELLAEKGFTGKHAGEIPHPKTLAEAGEIYVTGGRGEEIQAYLRKHPEVTSYAIVDDMSENTFTGLTDFFVQTSLATGITRNHVERLVTILGKT